MTEARATEPQEAPLQVLSIDDDQTALEILGGFCRSAGFEFTPLAHPAGAVEAALRLRPDVVLVDAMMPGVSGFEVCRRLRAVQELQLVPIVMVTSLDGRDERIRALDAGAQDFLSKPVDRIELAARVRSLGRNRRLVEALESADEVLERIARCVEARDSGTAEHCERLRRDGRAFGGFLGLAPHEIAALERAAVLHDIGKIAIPDAILHKPGPLDEAERAAMQAHAAIGADLLAPLASFARVVPIVRHHHERWDGNGYPCGLAGESIPRLARVFQLLDAYDALASDRPYKKAMDKQAILALLAQEAAEGRWDPVLFEQFRLWKEQDQ